LIVRRILVAVALAGLMPASALAQTDSFAILDNSFLVEEAFNQEQGIFQNIFTWARGQDGEWEGSFTQEWPAPTMRHQLSYTVPFVGGVSGAHLGSVLFNYRYQAFQEAAGRPAVSPRISIVLPTGSAIDDSNRPGMQFNIPVSKRAGAVYVHANVGLMWTQGVAFGETRGTNLTTPQLAGSAIWSVRPMFNLMIESVLEFEDAVRLVRSTLVRSREAVVTVSPGFRGGWNVGDHQIIVGGAVPVIAVEGERTAAFLGYFSYELPFTENR
jgi:hypothetical protein